MKIFLISMRLVIYYMAVLAPVFSPAVAAGYDYAGFVLWFIVVPAESVIAYAAAFRMFRPKIPGRKTLYLLSSTFLLPVLFLPVPGFSGLFYRAVILAAIILVLNILIFRFRIISLSFAEPFFIFFIYYRLLEFSRSSESVSGMSETVIIPLFFVLLVVSYLLLSMLLYFSSGRESFKDIKKEAAILLLVLVPVLVALSLLKPADYIISDFVFNFRDEKALTAGGTDGEGDGLENGVSGVPAERWGSRSRGSSGSGKQYAVMIAASEEDNLYSAWEYLDGLDQVKGFYIFPEQTLNTLKKQRFLETWVNPDAWDLSGITDDRIDVSAFYLSTTGDRVVPYIPYIIEPTVYSNESYPFSYSYNTVSLVSAADLRVLSETAIDKLDESDIELYSGYLNHNLLPQHEKIFADFIERNRLDNLPYNMKIIRLLQSFDSYQYELGFDEDMSVDKLSRFIEGQFPGDCSEFSNAAALIGRLIGIPSRVARGYLASENLQTPQHKQALGILRQSIRRISNIPMENLKLVTTAHKHSWVQFYVPGFGWTDFEATEFAIPPVDGDPNAGQIVIPIIRELTHQGRDYIFPWKLIISVFFIVVLFALTVLYIYKAVKLSYLRIMQNFTGYESFRYQYRYILHRMFLAGYPLKTRSMTPCQYGEINNTFSLLAGIYTELSYRENYMDDDKRNSLNVFGEEYRKLIIITKPRTFNKLVKYLLSFRGIFY